MSISKKRKKRKTLQNSLTRADCPTVSVIIPATRLMKATQTLHTLSKQDYAGEIEIIVVGPPAATLAQQWPIIAVHPQPVRQPGKARNIGATHAHGKVVLFLDDDMLVRHDWIARNVHELKKLQVGVVGARMPGKTRAFFSRCVDFTNYGHYQHKYPMEQTIGSGSMGLPKALFHEVGGFDESLLSGEDIDLCYRIQKLGYRTIYQPAIVVLHDHPYNTLHKLLSYNYAHGLNGGLTTKLRYHEQGWKNRLLYTVRFPPIFLLCIPIIAITATLHIMLLNLTSHKRILLYAPFILLGKLTYEFGIFMALLTKRGE